MRGPGQKDNSRRYEVDAEVVAHDRIIGHEFEIVFRAPEIASSATPGQFVELLFGIDYAPLVRRPFSIYRVDVERGTFSILYLARGSFTTGLAQQRPGDRVSLLGPLGNGFRWAVEPSVKHVLVAGGIGAPPIYFLARELTKELSVAGSKSSVTVINAARTRDLLAGMLEFGGLDVTLHAVTNDGTEGIHGLATDLASKLLQDAQAAGATCRLYACGPTSMLRAIGSLASEFDVTCQLSVETSMPCGIGMCQGCAIPVQAITAPTFRYSLACMEGPVYDSRCIVWPEAG